MAILLIMLLFLDLSARLRALAATGRDDCKPTRCYSDGPNIRYPFWPKDDQQQQQPKHCGYHSFDLSYDHENHTMLELPFSVKVAVKEIEYISQLIHTYDPHECFPQLLQNLNLPRNELLHSNSTQYMPLISPNLSVTLKFKQTQSETKQNESQSNLISQISIKTP
ncbi:putative RING-H2 finger protein ATL21A [Camellia lanceoleosa]|uniref:RING-H2 finger protein ATL21A n=1 Tax=Camellia lanceoleosa TaxID=1840588 RepID=A0ACC0FVF1_9ERIC|nr:putative RING-H2 finger protein ATL21A [Camellia lanceoleosa]